MNIFTGFKTVTKLDYHGSAYTVNIMDDKRIDLSKLWKSFAEVQLQNQRDIRLGSVSQSWQDREIIKEQIKNESI